MKENS